MKSHETAVLRKQVGLTIHHCSKLSVVRSLHHSWPGGSSAGNQWAEDHVKERVSWSQSVYTLCAFKNYTILFYEMLSFESQDLVLTR